MMNPSMAYDIAKHEHQARIAAAERSRVAREARVLANQGHTHWFSSVANRVRSLHAGARNAGAVKPTSVRPAGQVTAA